MNNSTFSLTIIILHIHCNTQPNLDVPSYIIILNLYHFLYHQKAVLLWKLLILTRCSFCSCVQWDNAAPGGGRPRMRRRPGRRKMVARGRGGGGGRRGEQTFSRIHIFLRSLDFCASIISRTFFCSTIFTRSKHFWHLHFCKDFHAYMFLQGSITFPASVFLQKHGFLFTMSKKRTFLVKLCMKYVIAS